MKFSEIVQTYKNKGLPEREALLLIGKAIGKKKEYVIAHFYDECPEEFLGTIIALFEKRLTGYPLQYIIGEVEFYGRMFYVEEGVLIPRWETEGLVDLSLEYIRKYKLRKVLDIGVGSGVIAISIALECASDKELSALGVEVLGTDVNEKAIALARKNAMRYSIKCDFRLGEFAEPFRNDWDSIDMIVSNPPYVRKDVTLQKELEFEPQEALFGGEDGLEFYREFFKRYDTSGKIVIMEIGEDQGEKLKALTGGEVLKDLAGKDRYLIVNKRS
ncbi:peptide chain release factor N(5)-glutamine methyltransferase [Fervidobacterium pennivorans subsp. carthaginiensis]|uniref:peptide chain release factor N(5)-glutamine methyltransferase n=1 Tax=Fervidobacterium pennivorans TaxID=93466 RepID=UPI0014367350|nr:peptide chain release factor N(5)-glutamine methyltransferase [Fervidobacterium pennivorans]QIV78859.1 peptide chain release factor N(5)-glutamine methyltransferase [Fervidobacterium pennivorans subsp. keratinolyticus]